MQSESRNSFSELCNMVSFFLLTILMLSLKYLIFFIRFTQANVRQFVYIFVHFCLHYVNHESVGLRKDSKPKITYFN